MKISLPDSKPVEGVEAILAERGSRYGKFADNASTSIRLQDILLHEAKGAKLTHSQKFAIQMITGKLARIVNGDPDYEDNWVDIIGYAELALKEIRNAKTEA